MNMKSDLSFLCFIFLLAFLAACAAPSVEAPIDEPAAATETPTGEAISAIPTPYCPAAASYGMIEELEPSLLQIVSDSPLFTWYYTNGNLNFANLDMWDSVCTPETYTLHLSTGPEFSDEILLEVVEVSIVRDRVHLVGEGTINDSLEPLTVYRWLMEGHAGGYNVDDYWLYKLHADSSSWYPRTRTYTSIFRTGPECTLDNISIPQLIYPEDGAIIQTLDPIGTWEVSECMPQNFYIEVSTLPTFDNPNEVEPIDPHESGDYTARRQTKYPWFQMSYMLRDCTTLYWHVMGENTVNENTYVYGTSSEIRTFQVDTGQCPTATPTRTRIPVLPTKTPTATPPPTSVPVNCSTLTTEDQCNAAGCTWYAGGAAAPHCGP